MGWISRIAAAVVVLGVLATLAGAASAGPGGSPWTQVATPSAGSASNSLQAVSCVTGSDCVAVGGQGTSSGLVERFDGSSWSQDATPTATGTVTLTGVSCPTSDFCAAVGWQLASPDYLPVAELWNGSTWTLQTLPDVNAAKGSSDVALGSVSCASTSLCVAVGNYAGSSFGYYALALEWNGDTWTESDPPSPGTNYTLPKSVSCAPASASCVAVGSYGDSSGQHALALDWTPTGGWTQDTDVIQAGATNNDLSAIACLAATSCVAAGYATSYYGNPGATGLVVQTWDGSTWTDAIDSSNTTQGVSGISCLGTGNCMLVGSQGSSRPYTTFSETFDGSSFAAVTTMNPAGTSKNAESVLSGVSCPGRLVGGAIDCTAVGDFVPVDQQGGAETEQTLALTTHPGSYAPVVDLLTPRVSPPGGGTSVQISGANFTGATSVDFGEAAATAFTVGDDGTITATAPDCGCSGATVHVTVTTPNGTSAVAPETDQFVYANPPTVTGLDPASGPEGGETSVDISGTGFTAATGVSFGATAAESIDVVSDTEITATSPAGSGTVDVTVTSPAGTSAASAADEFTYASPPTVTSVAPNAGPDSGGTSIVVAGSGFTGASEVDFRCDDSGGIPLGPDGFTVVSDSEIDLTTPPADIGDGTYDGPCDVVVTAPGGTSQTAAGDVYTYEPPSASLTVTRSDDPEGSGSCPDDCSLRQALASIASGGTVTLPAGTYRLTQGELEIASDVTLTGAGAATTSIDQTGGGRVLDIQSGTVSISGVTITGGDAGVGGGIWIQAGTVTLSQVTVSGNSASISGGGIDNDGALTIDRSEIRDNTVSGDGDLQIGGGIDHFGTSLSITNTTIEGNTAGIQGGGLLSGGDSTLENVTVSDNTAGSGGGGGVASGNDSGGTITMVNTLLDSNSDDLGASNCGGSISSNGHNLSTDSTCTDVLTAPGDLNGVPASQAVDAGDDASCPAVDQNGTARPQGPHCDIGALETVPDRPPTATFAATRNGLAVSVDGSTSSDPDGTVAAYAWNFGDGATGSGATADHTYAAAGTYTISLTVTDDGGATGSVSHDVTVAAPPTSPPPPSGGGGGGGGGGGAAPPDVGASLSGPVDGRVGKGVMFSATVRSSGGQASTGTRLSVSVPSGASLDSVSASQGSCAGSSCSLGTLEPGASATASFTVVPSQAGTLTVSVRVSGDGDSNAGDNGASVSVPVVAVGAAPPAPPRPSRPGTYNALSTGTVLVNGVAVPADTLFVVKAGDTVDVSGGIITFTTFDGSVGTFSASPPVLPRRTAAVGAPVQPAAGTVAEFVVSDDPDATRLTLVGGDFSVCTAPRKLDSLSPLRKDPSPTGKHGKHGKGKAKPRNKTVVRQLWGKAKGHFRTKARFSAATIRGTAWGVQDRCDGTLTTALQDVVDVEDLVLNKTVSLNPGQTYLAQPRQPAGGASGAHRSQTAATVKANGLHWGGRIFLSKQAFAGWLASKGSSWRAFRGKHGALANALARRG